MESLPLFTVNSWSVSVQALLCVSIKYMVVFFFLTGIHKNETFVNFGGFKSWMIPEFPQVTHIWMLTRVSRGYTVICSQK